MVSEYTLDITQ